MYCISSLILKKYSLIQNLWENTAQDNEGSTWTLFLLLAIETCGWGSASRTSVHDDVIVIAEELLPQ